MEISDIEINTSEKAPKKRLVVYLPHDLSRRLKRTRGETDKPVSQIVEEALSRHFDAVDRASSK